MELTIVRKPEELGVLSKRISLDATGTIKSDGSVCVMSYGTAHRRKIEDGADFARVVGGLTSQEAITLGHMRDTVAGTSARVVAERMLASASAGTIARTRAFIDFAPGEPAPMLIDADSKYLTDDLIARLQAEGGVWPAIVQAVPELGKAMRIERASTSAGIRNSQTGETYPSSKNSHTYIVVQDGADIPRALENLFDRLWLAGWGFYGVGKKGQLLCRSIIDASVGQPERLVFEGAPVVNFPLLQEEAARMPVFFEGEYIDTRVVLPPLSDGEARRLKDLRDGARRLGESTAAYVRQAENLKDARKIASTTGEPLDHVLERISHRQRGRLAADIELDFDDPEIGTKTVGDVLLDPKNYLGETLADPLEGLDYGRCKAKVLADDLAGIRIHSFAHGAHNYVLCHSRMTLERLIEATDTKDVIARYADALVDAMADEGSLSYLRDLVFKKTGRHYSPINRAIKEAKLRRARLRREAAQARENVRRDTRPRMPAPRPNGVRLDIARDLDVVLARENGLGCPLRGIDGAFVGIKNRSNERLHLLTSATANPEEADGEVQRVAAPEACMIERLDEHGVQDMLSRRVNFYTIDQGVEREVVLPAPFCKTLQRLDCSAVPTLRGVQTMPLVIGGEIVAPVGYNLALELAFIIDPTLRNILPKREDCTLAAAKKEYQFLVEVWLGDVAATEEGKAVLIASALSVVQRHLLTEKPGFLVSAGQRGSGKTTAISMISQAILGHRAPAAAWSPMEEERRKMLLSFAIADVPLVSFDNIARGTALKCKEIERYLTEATITDRVLGESVVATARTAAALFFTGNSVEPTGDLASRILSIRLASNRVDPENRKFSHPDPFAWTELNRGRILRALYMILALLRAEPASLKTRFKLWWRMIGHPIELVSGVDFAEIFQANEAVDEEAVATGRFYSAMRRYYGCSAFSASEALAVLDPSEKPKPREGTAAARESVAENPLPNGMGFSTSNREWELRQEEADRARGDLETASGKRFPPRGPTLQTVSDRLRALSGRVAETGDTVARLCVVVDKHAEANRYIVEEVRG
jgi:hypothetical protein